MMIIIYEYRNISLLINKANIKSIIKNNVDNGQPILALITLQLFMIGGEHE